ncbi:cysteine desulfurase family protein [Levilactobacillus parabrevis]|uniref:Cysteine sulfinate desulfinase cysteine desulfurase n=1 Tax=Levilactobacillus parabrevis ATCC 53295 TaxID=1267003 RepID=A0A0R1H3I9_9LACO|nr:cysteine desulfurase family protein [Levilactobacillus parabrevis]KRK37866.1 cysteine sulfinate desulfinase cysteine desulfurase [Levilactobacillus parabrevis ATCC 53295]KRO06425.1 cysteine sulfinate desulfinase cysteine desulfurase [Levilactobacillus parabrevis]
MQEIHIENSNAVKEIYLDNAATTPMAPEVLAEMMDKMTNVYGNASTLYGLGRQAHTVMENSRQVIANSINAASDEEIIFTSGGSEGDNTAITQTALARQSLGKHIITTEIEHEAVLKPLHALEEQGFDVTYLPVDEHGNISLDDFKAALRDDTILVTIMMGNNEVGSRMPIHEIGEILKDHQAWFHTDAVQTYGLLDIDVQRDHIDMLSTSAHKINGPKMIGFLYKREGVNFPSLIKGGDQEEKRRAGTENVPAIAGFAKAAELLTPEAKAEKRARFHGFKEQVVKGLTDNGVDFEINGSLGDVGENLDHVLNIWIKGISTYVMQTNLDLAGIAVSGGSACTAGSIEPSHVLTAMFGEKSPRIAESIRLSFGQQTTSDEIAAFVENVSAIVKRLAKNHSEVK